MKVKFERVIPDPGSSFRIININEPTENLKWEYHYHPEIELVCVVSGGGTRHVGYHKSDFINGDLVLIGSNIPHSGFGLNSSNPHEEIVIQFKEDILIFPEQETEGLAVRELLETAKYGILFTEETKAKMLPKLREIVDRKGYYRYIVLLQILLELARTKDYTLLNNDVMPYSVISKNKTRLQNIFTYVEQHFDRDIDIQTAANLANLTLPAFCNFFKKTTQITFTEFVNRYRISKACLFISQDKSISECGYTCGFNNVTYFNRTFKKYTGKTPSEFKKAYYEKNAVM